MTTTVPMFLPYSGQPYVEPLDFSQVRIQITWKAAEEIFCLVKHSRLIGKEISWVGKVSEPKQKSVYQITEVRALAQKCSGAETTLDAMEIGKLASKWIEECGGNYNPLKFWGHCHPGPCVAPSQQDNQQMALLARGQITPPFFIRGIFALVSPATCLAEFTVFRYDKQIAIRNVPWQIIRKRGER